MTSATLWTAVAAAAAGVSALFAALYTWLTFRLLRSQGEPNVVVYVRHDDSRPTILQIVIENIGRGLATELSFKSSRPIPRKAWGLSEEQIKPVEPMTAGPLVDGIPSLGPGDSRRIAWGQYYGLKKALGDQPLVLTCECKHAKRPMRPMVAILDVNSFAETDAVGSEGRRTIKELERIADTLEQMVKSRPQPLEVGPVGVHAGSLADLFGDVADEMETERTPPGGLG